MPVPPRRRAGDLAFAARDESPRHLSNTLLDRRWLVPHKGNFCLRWQIRSTNWLALVSTAP